MELSLVIALLFLSCFCTFILNHKMTGFFLALIATFYAMHGSTFLTCLLITSFVQSMHVFFHAKKNYLFWIIISLVLVYCAIIFIFKPYKINIYYFATYFMTLLFFIWTMFIKWDVKKIIMIVMALGIYLIIFGFGEWLIIRPTRIGGPFGVATAYAVLLVLIWAIWFVENCFSRRFSYFVVFFSTLLVFVAVLLSGTRMGLIGIAMGLFLGVAFSNWTIKFKNNTFLQKIFYSVLIIGCVLFFISIVWMLLPNDLNIKQGLNTILAGKMDSSSTGRVISWVVALNLIPEHKIWGIGPGNFSDIYKSFIQSLPYINVPNEALKHSHNMYLMLLSEFGLIGFFIFGFIIIACFIQLFYRIKHSLSVGIYYAFLSCGIIIMVLGLIDIIPLDLYTLGFGAWYMGVLASFSLTNEEIAK